MVNMVRPGLRHSSKRPREDPNDSDDETPPKKRKLPKKKPKKKKKKNVKKKVSIANCDFLILLYISLANS